MKTTRQGLRRAGRGHRLRLSGREHLMTLHLTSGQTCGRVDLVLDGEMYTAEVFGDGHQNRARALAIKVRDAIKGGSKADALDLIA